MRFVGCPAPYAEAIEARAGVAGLLEILDGSGKSVVLIHCDGEAHWERLLADAQDSSVVAIAILPSLEINDYARALSAGAAGVLYIDTPSSITVDAIVAATVGEVVLPRQAAQTLATLALRKIPNTKLDNEEHDLLRAVAAGRTIVGLAEELHYSERTVRRHLQSLYLKLGVNNRAEAISAAARMGLVDEGPRPS